MPRQDKVFVCFQKAEDDTHKLYIYDDVTAYGTLTGAHGAMRNRRHLQSISGSSLQPFLIQQPLSCISTQTEDLSKRAWRSIAS